MIPENELRAAAEAIRRGELVAFPTETVYGLGANALDARAVAKIYEAKGRPASSPLIVHVGSVEQARELAQHWSARAETLAARFWPGPLTLIVPKSAAIPGIVTAGLPSVGLRLPANDVAQALLREARVPIAAPSANRFTELSPTTAEHVRQSMGTRVGIILDGGPTTVGIESTVVELKDNAFSVLRPGVISAAEIEEVLGEHSVPAAAGPSPSPGQHPRHYRPRTPLYLDQAPPAGRGVTLKVGAEMPSDPKEYGAVLYALLHKYDAEGLDWICVEMPPNTPEWEGVRDRLRRAAAS